MFAAAEELWDVLPEGFVQVVVGSEGLLQEKKKLHCENGRLSASETSLLSLLVFVSGTEYARLLAFWYTCNIIRVEAIATEQTFEKALSRKDMLKWIGSCTDNTWTCTNFSS